MSKHLSVSLLHVLNDNISQRLKRGAMFSTTASALSDVSVGNKKSHQTSMATNNGEILFMVLSYSQLAGERTVNKLFVSAEIGEYPHVGVHY
jgi:hypothetical protein